MANIKAFKGLRPRKDIVQHVAELPYDVVTSDEARKITENNNYSFYHITKPEVDLPPSVDQYDPQVYNKGLENLEEFISSGVLQYDENPCLYLYTLVMGERSQTGLVTCINIDDYLNNTVKKHELTREDKEIDRMTHVDVLSAQTGLVYLLYNEDGTMTRHFQQALSIEPVYDYTARDGIRHIIRVIDDPGMVNDFISSFSGIDLYIADGHHRAASAVKAGLKRREQNPDAPADAEYNFFLGVIFPHDQLRIMAYNRAVRDLNGLSSSGFISEVEAHYSMEKSDISTPAKKNTVCMYIDRQWYLLTPKFEIPDDPIESLDVRMLQNKILDPVLGIKNPRTDKRIDFIGGIKGAEELARIVDNGDFAVAFSMYPTSVEDLMNVSDSGGIMPPKSTWFEPKLRSGLIIHRI